MNILIWLTGMTRIDSDILGFQMILYYIDKVVEPKRPNGANMASQL